MNIFERASRRKLRFPSDRGELSTEQLWDLDLLSLDKIARTVNTALKSVTEESFIETKPNPAQRGCELQLEIVKHVIASKQADIKAAEARAEKADRRRKLVDALGAKEEEELGKKSKAQLIKDLAKLDGAEEELEDA